MPRERTGTASELQKKQSKKMRIKTTLKRFH